MNSHFQSADYKSKRVVEKLNSFCSENAGSIENCTVEYMSGIIEDLIDARDSLAKGRKLKFGDE